MKTPREILLKKHQAAQPMLDRLRHEVLGSGTGLQPVSGLSSPSQQPHGQGVRDGRLESRPYRRVFTFFLSQLWRELILPAGRIWSGLAVAWAVIILVNLSDSNSLPGSSTPMAETTPEVRLALAEQRRLIAELIAEPAVEEPAAPPRHYPRPRSDRRIHLKLA